MYNYYVASIKAECAHGKGGKNVEVTAQNDYGDFPGWGFCTAIVLGVCAECVTYERRREVPKYVQVKTKPGEKPAISICKLEPWF